MAEEDEPPPKAPLSPRLQQLPARAPLLRNTSTFVEERVAPIDTTTARQARGLVVVLNLVCTGLETDIPGPYWSFVEVGFVVFYVLELLVRLCVGRSRELEGGREHGPTETDDEEEEEEEEEGVEQPLVPRASGSIPRRRRSRRSTASLLLRGAGAGGGGGGEGVWKRRRCCHCPQRRTLLNLVDAILALLGMIEIVMLMLELQMKSIWAGHNLIVLRLLRVVRIFYLFDSLAIFVQAYAKLVSVLVWLFGILALVIFVSATFVELHISCVEVLHKDGADSLCANFSNIGSSMFALFRVMTLDDWELIADPLIRRNPIWRVFFVVFIAFCSWLMISMMTAVVADHLIQTTQVKKDKERLRELKSRERFAVFLRDLFLKADVDGNGILDKEEFNHLIEGETVLQKMKELGVTIPREDLQRAFAMFDVDDSGELTAEEFTEGFGRLQQSLTTKHVISIQYMLQRIFLRMSRALDNASALVASEAKLLSQTSEVIERINDTIVAMRQEVQRRRAALASESSFFKGNLGKLGRTLGSIAGPIQARTLTRSSSQKLSVKLP